MFIQQNNQKLECNNKNIICLLKVPTYSEDFKYVKDIPKTNKHIFTFKNKFILKLLIYINLYLQKINFTNLTKCCESLDCMYFGSTTGRFNVSLFYSILVCTQTATT